MRNDLNLVFWQPSLSIHFSSILNALAEDLPVTLVAEEGIQNDRVAMGWHEPSLKSVQTYVNPDEATIKKIFDENKKSIHIISGVRGCKYVDRVLQQSKKDGFHIVICSEACDSRGWKGILRQALYRYKAFRYAHQVDLIFAFGQLGVQWYRDTGFKSKKTFSLCYVVDSTGNETDSISQDETYRFLFVGALIRRKAVDILLQAIAKVQGKWVLEIVGDGPERKGLELLSQQLGIDDRVIWTGTLENMQVRKQLNNSDVLILPSRFDGWGAVVNEALTAGLPVVCSDRCGAKDLLTDSWRGMVFQTNSVSSLTSVLQFWYDSGKRTTQQTSQIREWSQKSITGKVVADYFLSVINYYYFGGKFASTPW